MATAEMIDTKRTKESDAEYPKKERIYQLSPKVHQSIEIALQQVRDGQTIPGETVFREIDEWLGSDD